MRRNHRLSITEDCELWVPTALIDNLHVVLLPQESNELAGVHENNYTLMYTSSNTYLYNYSPRPTRLPLVPQYLVDHLNNTVSESVRELAGSGLCVAHP